MSEEIKLLEQYLEYMKDVPVGENIAVLWAIEKLVKKYKEDESKKCLRCEEGKPAYCEKCFQEVIGWNAKMQGELNEENLRCAEFAIENYVLKDKLRYEDLQR